MFQQGEQVVYGIHGVCKVLGLENRMVDRKNLEYYILEPIEQPGTRFYVPTQNQAAVAKLRPILTKGELEDMLSSTVAIKDGWISDENQRKQKYRELINSGDIADLICMVRALRQHKAEQLHSGRKFHLCDENFLRDAEHLLGSELTMVLNIKPNEVGRYIEERVTKE